MTFHRIRLAVRCLALFILAACFSSIALNAQSTTQGAIAGSVLDSSGAAIPGANVNIEKPATGFTVKEVSDSSGYFIAPLLEPGDYSVSITAKNFANYRADHVVVVVGHVTGLEPRLAVASSSAQVIVTEQTPVMNLESPDFSDTLDLTALQSIPINNRRWSSLAMSTPGVVLDTSGFGLVSVRGISTLLNNVEIDGADDNDAFYSEERGRTREAYSTTAAAVREFAVNTGVYSAEYGRAAGGVITSVTSSGTNKLHGQAYFWDRESNWAGYNDYSTITSLVNGANVTSHYKPEDLRKIYGFTAGGPLIKDKLFWIYTYDQHTRVFPVAGVPFNPLDFYTLPQNAASMSAAGETCDANGYLTGASSTNFNDINACTLAARQGISYQQAAYDWAALLYGNANVSASNYPGATTITDLGVNSTLGEVARFGYQEINMPKLDWQISARNHWSIVYNRLRWDSPGGVQTSSVDNYARDTDGNDFVKLDYGVTKLTSMITSNISNEVLYQYSRELLDETQQPFTQYTTQDLTTGGNTPEVLLATSPDYGFDLGSPYYSYRIADPLETKWQAGDVLYWDKGNHSLKFGADLVHNYDLLNNLFRSNGYISYYYLGNYFNDVLNFKNGVLPTSTNPVGCNSSASQNPGSSTATVTGDYPCYHYDYQGFGTPTFAIATLDTGIFAQDNWKVNPRLTLELGLRWDHEAIPVASPNLLASVTTPYTFVPFSQLGNNPSEYINFGPRIGFSYNVFGSGNTVLRGGWGMYYGRLTNGNIENVRLSTGSPNGQIDPEFLAKTAGAPFFPHLATAAASVTPTAYYFASNFKLPEVQEFDLLLQQAVGKGTFFQLSYLGSLGRELPNFLDVNLNPSTVEDVNVTVADLTNSGPLGPNGTVINNVPQYTSYGNANLFGATGADYSTITEMISNVNSNYNAFVAEILNHTLHSVQFDANYTWSHGLDYSQNAATQGAANGEWFDPYSDARINYGNSAWNTPNRFVAYAIYNFPNLNSANPLKWVTNDWNIDTSFQMANGLPFTPGASNFFSPAINDYWNGSSGSTVIPGVGGINQLEVRRGIVDDMRLQKAFSFEGGRSLQLMLNVFNIANHQNVTSEGTSAYYLGSSYSGCNTTSYCATYLLPGAVPAGSGISATYKVISNTNASGFEFTPREAEIAARFNF